MRIERFLSSMIVADGGTVVCRALLADGSELELGLDARIPKQKSERVVFTGAYPGMPESRLLTRGSEEEKEVIDAVQRYLDERVGFLRREALAATNSTDIPEADRSDAIAVDLFTAILDR